MGHVSTTVPKRARSGEATNGRRFRVINRDQLVKARGSRPDGELAVQKLETASPASVAEYETLAQAVQHAQREFRRTLDNVVVVAPSGEIVLELGLE